MNYANYIFVATCCLTSIGLGSCTKIFQEPPIPALLWLCLACLADLTLVIAAIIACSALTAFSVLKDKAVGETTSLAIIYAWLGVTILMASVSESKIPMPKTMEKMSPQQIAQIYLEIEKVARLLPMGQMTPFTSLSLQN